MDRRRTILCLLLALAVVYHALIIGQIFFSERFMAETLSGVMPIYSGGGVIVSAVRDMRFFGDADASAGSPVRVGDRVVRVSASLPADLAGLTPYRTLAEYQADLSAWVRGQPLFMVVDREDGPSPGRRLLRLPSVPEAAFGWRARLGVFLIFELVPLGFMFAAFLFGFQQAGNPHAWLACLIFYTVPAFIFFTFSTLPPAWMAFALVYRHLVSIFPFYLMLRFFFEFPEPSPLHRRLPFILPTILGLSLAYGLSRVVFVLEFTGMRLDPAWSAFLSNFQVVMFRFFLLTPFLGLLSLTLNTFRASGRTERRRMAVLWAGSLVSLGAFLSSTVTRYFFNRTPSLAMTAVVILLMGMMPLAFLYAALRHRLLGIRLILRGGIRHLLASRGFLLLESAVLFALFTFYVGPAAERLLPGADRRLVHAAFLTAVLAVTFGLNRLNPWILNRIDRKFFREACNVRKIFADLGRAIRAMAHHPERLPAVVADTVRDALHVEDVRVCLVAVDPRGATDVAPGNRPGTWRCVYCTAAGGGAWPDEGEAPGMAGDGDLSQRLLPQPGAPEILDVPAVPPDGRSPVAGPGIAGADEAEARLARLGVRLLVPLPGPAGLVGVLALGEKQSEEPYTREDRELLSTVGEQAGLALDYARLMRDALERERLQRELEIARDVQERLFPQVLPPMARLAYTGACRPAGGVGGDYFDFVFLGEGRLGLALGDVSGKGISAALLMAGLQGMLRVSAPLRGDAVERLLGELNAALAESTSGERFATFFYAVWDDGGRSLRYVNAGHNPPFRLRAGGGEPEFLEAGGTLLGAFPDAAFERGELRLGAGDLLVLYSDGVTEALDPAGEEYGVDRLVEAFRRRDGLPVEQAVREVLDEVSAFAAGAPPRDDMTLVAARCGEGLQAL
ncbi:MAG: SpoIIE family protein phosphatase [Acidobacteria bacterium]|nr:SpoIIE family protein phosphatase [Acidobacteriota bacterium]